ncbi:MAG: isoamylase early set domain-containing protein [Ignavibacteriales bacterium]|nr:isoamylase early set domain-containing protein [Ignavibacteriales bacterium]MBK7978768.1 isoamylase early set domain-containing protein [Ignavibacteriota bacterium]
MSISKRYLKSKKICKVTFKIPAEIGVNYKRANILGSFNNWDYNSHRMKKLVKDGSFSIVIDLEVGKEYEFKYYLDNSTWLNEKDADSQIATQFGDSSNSIVKV